MTRLYYYCHHSRYLPYPLLQFGKNNREKPLTLCLHPYNGTHTAERQADLKQLELLIPELLGDRDVLEVAAGTGYWTSVASRAARSILATDGATETLALIHHRSLACPVQTRQMDAYHLRAGLAIVDNPDFDAAFAGLWFSHIPIQRRAEWLDELHACLQPGARVVLLDNTQTQTVRLPITRTDAAGNTYQSRLTDNNESFEVLKNFPTEDELLALTSYGKNHVYKAFDHFWLFHFDLA